MLDESLTIGTDEENYQVTAVISHIVRSGREQGYEEWFRGIAADARTFKGHLLPSRYKIGQRMREK